MNKKLVVGVGAVCLVAFAAGRYTAPEKVRVEIKTVEVEKKTENRQTDVDKDKHKDTVVVEVVKPDGTKETTTHTVEDTKTDKTTNVVKIDDTTRAIDSVKEVTSQSSKLSISALAGGNLSFTPSLQFGAHIQKNLIGPVTIGAWFLTPGIVGLSLGLTF